MKKIKTALISVYYKNGIDTVATLLKEQGVQLYSTGGTYDYLQKIDPSVKTVESLTGYPSILGGRVKTLHPKVFGGILGRTGLASDQHEMAQYEIPAFDLVVVDLYPFEETVANGGTEEEIIEKIDIGGISLIRAGAKNFNDVLIVPSRRHYDELIRLLETQQGETSLEDRKRFAGYAFAESSRYDSAIYRWFARNDASPELRISEGNGTVLRYGENPHQKGMFYGDLDALFEKLHGKELSYNNLLDLEAGLSLVREFDTPTFAILKHNNPCGIACRPTVKEAYLAALAGDPVSAFGGVLVCNRPIDLDAAEEINKLFIEVIVAPDYGPGVLDLLFSKKNRVVLRLKQDLYPTMTVKTALNGYLVEDRDLHSEGIEDFQAVTKTAPSRAEVKDMIFANKVVKHSRSNAITLAKDQQLYASGIGQTSRVDALRLAIEKAHSFGFDLHGAVLASDAFFPFDDCVKLAHEAGITAIIQPGGSVRDQESIDCCDQFDISMVFTGFRHFKH
ncbi:MAG: bifunctional phosphoribosylaminoimidazolecarboxamide formyltransferase/IMP cyclohydrolase [Bacteroidales bacterium]|nr:bifunctional phosphoribosylaminoimidazolecarboxamide formyltransferase/IMP cyclohydrolase [Bacteroidales bacterium]